MVANGVSALVTVMKSLEKNERIGNERRNQDHPVYNIGKNTEENVGDLRRHDIIQPPRGDIKVSCKRPLARATKRLPFR